MTMTNPVDAQAVAALILLRFRDCPDDKAVAVVATDDGRVARLTYGHLRQLLTVAHEAEDRLWRIAARHDRERGPTGMVGDLCAECGWAWPCDTRRMTGGD